MQSIISNHQFLENILEINQGRQNTRNLKVINMGQTTREMSIDKRIAINRGPTLNEISIPI